MTPFIGTIRAFGFNFAPYGWALCSGQLLPISQNTALFSLLGTTYGGNGTTTFGLPNLNGNVVVGSGTLPGGSTYDLGEVGGVPQVTLTTQTIPQHNHSFTGAFTTTTPGNEETAATPTTYLSNPIVKTTTTTISCEGYVAPSTSNPVVAFNPQAIGVTGQSLPHSNMAPYLAINFCICLYGAFPSFN
ncbi:MAG: phage tail protein [Candidatus Saccharimonadales bacterium]